MFIRLICAESRPNIRETNNKPVKLVVGFAPGGAADYVARNISDAMGKSLGQSIIVENKAGAGSSIAAEAVSKAAPDGYTLSVVSNNVVIFPSVIKNLPFEMPGDFTPIAVLGATPLVLVANPQKMPTSSSREFIAALRAKPDGYNFGSGGTGTILHLAAEMFVDEARVKARHIPYKGVGPMVTDLLGGQIDFAVLALPSVQQHIKSGALKAVGMCGDKRSAAAPDIPTFVEQGLPTYVIDAWFGVLGPKGMSAATVKKVNDALVLAFNDPAVKEVMAKQGNTIAISTPEHAQRVFRSEMERFAALVKKVGIEPQ